MLGGPGTGKTTTAIEAVVARVESGEATPDQCLILTSSRVAAGSLRERVTARLGGTSTEPLARTHQALGFGILRQAAALRGDPTPRLLSGPEQDVILRELLAGHAEEGAGPDWPERVHLALGTRGFRGELRDLLMRAVEHDLEPGDLVRLGREHDRPEWVAAAEVLAEYDEVTALSAPGAYDPAWILGAAADLLDEDPTALGRLVDGLSLVVVDDAQELTSAAARLLRTMASPGLDLILLGDPDSAVQTFRGADPRHLSDGWTQLSNTGERAARGHSTGGRTGDGPPGNDRTGRDRTGRDRTGREWSGGGPRTLVLPTAYRLPQAVVDAVGQGGPEDRRPRRWRPAWCRCRTGRWPGRRAAAARREPGGELRRGGAPRVAPAVRHPLVGDGRHRPWAGPHRDVATRADGGGGARRRDRHRPARA